MYEWERRNIPPLDIRGSQLIFYFPLYGNRRLRAQFSMQQGTTSAPMNSPPNPELSQLVDTFRALSEEDLTEPLLPKMRTLVANLERHCRPAEQPLTPQLSNAASVGYAS